MHINKKLLFTIKNFKETAYHYYGNSPFSLIQFVYYGLFRVNTFLVFEKDLRGQIPEVDLDSQVRLIEPTLEELDRLRHGIELPREFFCDKIHYGKRCCLAFYKEEIAYIHWVYCKGMYSRFLVLGENVCEINHIATLPRFRRKGISLRALANDLKVLQGLGYKKAVAVVHRNNVVFIKNVGRLDFIQTECIKALGPFSRKVIVEEPVRERGVSQSHS